MVAMSTGPLSERLHSAVAPRGRAIAVTLAGTADLDAREALLVWMGELHAAAVAQGCRRVEVNLHELEFMSSMCVNVLVGWLVSIMDLPLTEQYEVHLLWDKRQLWQRRSVHALRRFAPRIVHTVP